MDSGPDPLSTGHAALSRGEWEEARTCFEAAELLGCGRPGSWRRWRADLEAEHGARELVVRAWDSAASTQPQHPADIWNLKGYMNNAWHRVRFTAAGGG